MWLTDRRPAADRTAAVGARGTHVADAPPTLRLRATSVRKGIETGVPDVGGASTPNAPRSLRDDAARRTGDPRRSRLRPLECSAVGRSSARARSPPTER
jgi:hypothetical protein